MTERLPAGVTEDERELVSPRRLYDAPSYLRALLRSAYRQELLLERLCGHVVIPPGASVSEVAPPVKAKPKATKGAA